MGRFRDDSWQCVPDEPSIDRPSKRDARVLRLLNLAHRVGRQVFGRTVSRECSMEVVLGRDAQNETQGADRQVPLVAQRVLRWRGICHLC